MVRLINFDNATEVTKLLRSFENSIKSRSQIVNFLQLRTITLITSRSTGWIKLSSIPSARAGVYISLSYLKLKFLTKFRARARDTLKYRLTFSIYSRVLFAREWNFKYRSYAINVCSMTFFSLFNLKKSVHMIHEISNVACALHVS